MGVPAITVLLFRFETTLVMRSVINCDSEGQWILTVP